MPVRPIADAKLIIDKHVPDIVGCFERGYQTYFERFGSGLSLLEVRTKRGMMRDIIVNDELRPWSDSAAGVQFHWAGNLKWFGFENQWILRVKYLDSRDCVAVSPTGQSDEYDRNEVPDSIAATLLNDTPATMLYLGHRVNENAPTSPDVAIVCNNKFARPEWVWPLSGDFDAGTADMFPPVEPQDKPAVRVRLKGGGVRREEQG